MQGMELSIYWKIYLGFQLVREDSVLIAAVT